jgi:hypothetical protein
MHLPHLDQLYTLGAELHDDYHGKGPLSLRFPIETSIYNISLVTSTMILVWLVDSSIVLPYGALFTRIIENARVSIVGIWELLSEKAPINLHFLNASNTHLRETGQEQRPRRPLRMARMDGASAFIDRDERLDQMEAMLWDNSPFGI